MLLSLCGIAINLLKPWPFKFIVDNILPAFTGHDDSHQTYTFDLCPLRTDLLGHDLDRAALRVIVLLQIVEAWCAVTTYIFVKIGLEALLKLRTELYAYLQSLSLKYHDARRSSDSTFRVAYDSQAIQTIYSKGFTNIFGSVFSLVSTFRRDVQIDWQLALLSLGVVPLMVVTIYFFANRIRRESTSLTNRTAPSSPRPRKG